jgi:hypothetical protein
MTSAEQNALESAKDGATFRSGLVEGGKENLMAGSRSSEAMKYPN